MARIPDDLARELVEWAATAVNIEMHDGQTVYCGACGADLDEGDHADTCLHVRALYWLAAEEMQRPDSDPDEAGPGMRAKVVGDGPFNFPPNSERDVTINVTRVRTTACDHSGAETCPACEGGER